MDKHIAIIGSGVSGLAAAYHLRGKYRLTLFEQNAHIGGHAHTIDVSHQGERLAVDIAFMVYNRRNYPRFCALLTQLGISGEPTDMSFSVVHEDHNICYNGGSLAGLIADKRNLFQLRFWLLLKEILRFNRLAKRTLQKNSASADETLQQFIERHRLAAIFSEAYLLPMGASIWSCAPQKFSRMPVLFVLNFFNNHGLLDLTNRPQWLHIRGGSRRYVQALVAAIPQLECRHAPVLQVHADASVQTADRHDSYDAVIIATHAPQALSLLSAPTARQQDILGAFRYTQTRSALHTDTRLLPTPLRAHAAWNYRIAGRGKNVYTYPTYHLSRLQHLPADPPLMLTLNIEQAQPRAEHIITTLEFSHPLPDVASVAAQRRFGELNSGGRLFFCGAYWGNGFHEDGVVSGEAAAKQLAATLKPAAPAP